MKLANFFIMSLITAAFMFSTGIRTEAAITPGKVISDFKKVYELPKKRKLLKIQYLGKPRNFSRMEGLIRVYYHARKIAVYNLFTECGLKVKYTWEVWYRKRGRQLSFAQIAIWDHKFLNKPPKKLPGLNNSTITDLINKNLADKAGYQTYKAKALKVSVKKKTGKYNFCMPVYEVISEVEIIAGEEHKNIADLWRCTMTSNIRKKSGTWEINSHDCMVRGKKQACVYEKVCKRLGTRSKVTTINWETAKPLILARLKKNSNFKITGFKKFDFIRQENTSKSGLDTWFVVHSIKKHLIPRSEGYHNKDYIYTYDCYSYFRLGFHSTGSKKWEVDDSECCSSPKKKCYSGSCSRNSKCKLVSKVPVDGAIAKKPAIPVSGDLVDCSNSEYQLKSSPRSLLGWSRSYHNYIVKNGAAPTYCEKAMKYEGSAYCQNKKDPETIRMLRETLSICNK